MSDWTNEPDLKRLDGLRNPGPREMRGGRSADRDYQRALVSTTAEARLGVAVADLALESRTMNNAGLIRIIPAMRTANLPSEHPQLSLAARMSRDRAQEEKTHALDGRWTGIAQTVATQARAWINATPNVDRGEGLGTDLQKEVRRASVGVVAAKASGIGASTPITKQLETAVEPEMKRVALFMSMGPDIEAAIDKGARQHAKTPLEERKYAEQTRFNMAAARAGALTPKQVVEAARSPILSTLDELTPGGRPMAHPAFGHRFVNENERTRAIAMAKSSPEAPVPAKWVANAVEKTMPVEMSRNAKMAATMQHGHGIS